MNYRNPIFLRTGLLIFSILLTLEPSFSLRSTRHRLTLSVWSEATLPYQIEDTSISFLEFISINKSNATNSSTDSISINATNVTNSSTDSSEPPMTVDSLDDGTCVPGCQNGGLCKQGLCYCKGYYGGDRCENHIILTEEISYLIFTGSCIILFFCAILLTICCGFCWMKWEAHKAHEGHDLRTRMNWNFQDEEKRKDNNEEQKITGNKNQKSP